MNQNWIDYEINNAEWKVPVRYSNLTPLGQGAYGLVWLNFNFIFD